MTIKKEFVHSFIGLDGRSSKCHIRILEGENKPFVVLCSQMASNEGTSITNMVEYTALEIKKYLEEDNVTLTSAIQSYMKSSSSTDMLKDLVYRLKKSNIIVLTLESVISALEYRNKYKDKKNKLDNFIWIEHYPPGVGLVENGSYAMVTFNSDTWEPSWNDLNINNISSNTGYGKDEFDTPKEALES